MGNYKKYGNVMIDLETLSTHTNASIIEIGAVEFNKIAGETGESIDIFIKPQEWGMHERHIDGNTIKWWLSQSDEARKRFYEVDTDKIVVGLSESLVILSAFIRSCDNTDENEEGNVVVWGNSATMDITIHQKLHLSI